MLSSSLLPPPAQSSHQYSSLKMRLGLVLSFLVILSLCQGQVPSSNTNLSLFEISPCDGPHLETVSRFKSDIYAVKHDLEKCMPKSWEKDGLSFSKTCIVVYCYGDIEVNNRHYYHGSFSYCRLVYSVRSQCTTQPAVPRPTSSATPTTHTNMCTHSCLQGLRVRSWIMNSSSMVEESVVFVSRQSHSAVSSWSIPFKPDGFEESFFKVERTMCPSDFVSDPEGVVSSLSRGVVKQEEDGLYLFYVDVFSSSVEELSYGIQVDLVPQFVLKMDQPISVTVGAASPQIFYFKFPNGSSTVRVRAETPDDRCVFVSVQKSNCPINDLLETARSRGIYQTMSKTASLTVTESQVDNREFVVVLITTNYSLCHKKDTEDHHSVDVERTFSQNVTITVRDLEPISSYVLPMFLPFLVFIGYIVLICIYAFLLPRCYFRFPGKGVKGECYARWPNSVRYLNRRWRGAVRTETESLLESRKNGTKYNSMADSSDRKAPDINNTVTSASLSQSSDLEASVYSINTDFDESKHVLPRMCKTGYHKLSKQYSVYSWNTFTVGIFYALPAFQLVLSEQQILNSGGDQDKCYYNFKCAHPLGVISAFNNIWSNVGYVLLGGLFFIIVWYRDAKYRRKRRANKEYIDSRGVPQLYGIYYGMAVALIIEGFMSAFYHICPSNANFQFDTAFMFIIGGLFLVKILQNRHPDINVNAFVAFFTFAIVIFMTLIGLYVDVDHPYAIRSAVFLVSLILVFSFLVSFYHFHSWPDVKELKERMRSCGRCPRKKWRFYKLLGVAILNIVLAVVCIVVHNFLDIATCVLVFFVANLLVFLLLYVLQKLIYLEKLTVLPLFLILVIGCLWLSAFVFFMGLATTDWMLTPAESRTKNHDCFILGFYDYHDVWHFFSASAMFFSFSFLLTIDDGVQHTSRDKLRVF